MDNAGIYELMSVTRNNEVTLSAAMIFSPYLQAYFPQLCITAIREDVINALVHRDYSIHTEVDQLGKMQPDTRNPVSISRSGGFPPL